MRFFSKVREIGYRPWIDLRARAIHLKQVALTPEGDMIPDILDYMDAQGQGLSVEEQLSRHYTIQGRVVR